VRRPRGRVSGFAWTRTRYVFAISPPGRAPIAWPSRADAGGTNLEAYGDVECEIVALGDYRVETCGGCKLRFEKGEKFCPLKDDRDVLIGKIMASDGVVGWLESDY
jgi:hypothetical protein